MKAITVMAVVTVSASLGVLALPAEARVKVSDDSVTVVSAGRHGGGGGGGHGGGFSRGGGHASGARGYSGGRGYSGSRGYSGARSAGTHAYHPRSTAGRFPIYGPRTASQPNTGQRFSSQRSAGEHRFTSQGTPRQQRFASQGAKGQQIKRNQLAVSRAKGVGAANQAGGSNKLDATLNQKSGAIDRHTLATRDGRTHKGNWSRHDPRNSRRFDAQTQQRLRNWDGHHSSLADAQRRHHENTGHDGHNGEGHHGHHGHHHHGHDWWDNHCGAIVLVDWGWWGWWDGWWYPAWGYDPYYSHYYYDGPIYGYDGLPPDEIVANVQSELQRLGYYVDAVDGILGPLTQEALNRYQQDNGLPVTGTVDQATIGSLGLS